MADSISYLKSGQQALQVVQGPSYLESISAIIWDFISHLRATYLIDHKLQACVAISTVYNPGGKPSW